MILSAFLKVRNINYQDIPDSIKSTGCLSNIHEHVLIPSFFLSGSNKYAIDHFGFLNNVHADFVTEKKVALYSLWEKEISDMRKAGADVEVCFGRVTT